MIAVSQATLAFNENAQQLNPEEDAKLETKSWKTQNGLTKNQVGGHHYQGSGEIGVEC